MNRSTRRRLIVATLATAALTTAAVGVADAADAARRVTQFRMLRSTAAVGAVA